MEKPEDISAEAWAKAEECWQELTSYPNVTRNKDTEIIARAILSAVEEERAAIEAIVAPYRHRDTGYEIHQAIIERRNRKGA